MLERARTERGLSLRQVEEATRIRAKYLNDLERENFDVLPAVYVVGSLKTYADYLGLDGEALVLELKSRQASQQEDDQDQTDEDQVGGGFLASLVAILGLGDQGTAGGGEHEAPATEQGNGSRVYWGLGAVLILILTVAFVSSIGGGDQPAVSKVREPTIPGAPSRIALSSDLQDGGEAERDQVASNTDESHQSQAKPADEAGEKEEKSGQRAQDDALTAAATGDVEITIPMPNTGPTGLSSSATAASRLAATSYSSASSAATASPAAEPASEPASTEPEARTPEVVEPDATPEVDDAGASPGPMTAEPAPGATGTASASAGAPDDSGSGQAEGGGLDASELSDDIFDEVEDATSVGQ